MPCAEETVQNHSASDWPPGARFAGVDEGPRNDVPRNTPWLAGSLTGLVTLPDDAVPTVVSRTPPVKIHGAEALARLMS